MQKIIRIPSDIAPRCRSRVRVTASLACVTSVLTKSAIFVDADVATDARISKIGRKCQCRRRMADGKSYFPESSSMRFMSAKVLYGI